MSPIRNRRGFTLIELLVVISIIATLMGLLLPAVQKVREAAARMKCQNNIKQLALGVHSYENAFGKLPPGAQGPITASGSTINGTSWLVLILPQIEQGNLYNNYNIAANWNTASNLLVGAQLVPTFLCPSGAKMLSANASSSEPGNNTTHYYAIMGPGSGAGANYPVNAAGTNGAVAIPPAGMLGYYDSSLGIQGVIDFTDVTDGTSNTIMIGEMSMDIPPAVGNQYLSWIRGNNGGAGAGAAKNVNTPINGGFYNGNSNLNDLAMGSNHIMGANFALGDGSVRYISQTIDLPTYIAATSIKGKEVVSLP